VNASSIVSWVLFVAVFALTRALTRAPYADLFGPGVAASLASFGTAAALGLLVPAVLLASPMPALAQRVVSQPDK
jgi:hypothetical protein